MPGKRPKKLTDFRLDFHERNLHSAVLDSLQYRLSELGILYENVFWTMREGMYKPNGHLEEFPDLIIFLKEAKNQKRPHEAIPIELKTGKESVRDFSKAVHQLYNGAKFAMDFQNVPVNYGIFVSTKDGAVLSPRRISYDEMERRCI